MIGFFQRIVYSDWLPILFGTDGYKEYFGKIGESTYDDSVAPIVFNEVATAAFRLHTLVRDLYSRCTPDGKRIDQLWLHDISHKAKYAYDIEAYGLDSIICGSLYDFGFAHDGNFAHQIHNRLFETVNQYKQLWRNDLVAINICRGREHGVRSYNAYREYCKFPKARYFEDFGDTINYDGIKLLESVYKDAEDVDLFIALNLEDPIPGGIIGPVSACLLAKQFKTLRDGDRHFYSHPGVFTEDQLRQIQNYPLYCFVCKVVDIDEVPANPFKPPNDSDNKLEPCSSCPALDASDWKE